MSLKSAFINTAQNQLSRRWGGHSTGVADPYITGYHFIWFDKLPNGLMLEIGKGDRVTDSIDKGDVQKILAATCTGVTPPGGTLNKIEFTGLGGVPLQTGLDTFYTSFFFYTIQLAGLLQ